MALFLKIRAASITVIQYLILLNTSLKKQGAKIAKYVGICSIYIKKTTYTYFKKNYVVNFSDIILLLPVGKPA